ncbi:MAG: DUF805 domain-containing protein [Ilumatobacteraceae bacterium]|jgi:uncharacterized membrane protein YhaH (DUF805 family)
MQIITYWKRGFLENYANFKGRDTRPEFWWFYLANVILTYGLFILGGITGASILGLIGLLYGLAVIVPGIAAGVRRLHDTGKSGWLMLVSLIPLVGGIILIVFLAQPGTPGANEYGPPTGADASTGDAGMTTPPPPPPPPTA